MRAVAVALGAIIVAAALAHPAAADWRGREHGGWHHSYYGYYSGGPVYVAPPPVYYYEPAPVIVYSSPPPVIYAEPPAVVYTETEPPIDAVPASPTYADSQGRACREYQSTVVVAGRTQQGYGTACRQPDGAWQIVR